jgi:hypothetical protein
MWREHFLTRQVQFRADSLAEMLKKSPRTG